MSAPIPSPLALIAELTHRCPLHCVYCSNPVSLAARDRELSTETWSRVLGEAAELGVLQADFTGGEPLARPDLAEIIRAARGAGLYVNLITRGFRSTKSGWGIWWKRGWITYRSAFRARGRKARVEFAGMDAQARKLRAIEWIKRQRIALTLNFVIHRQNVDQLEEMLALVEQDWSRARGIRARAILRMGICEQREPAANARAARTVAGDTKRAEERLRGEIKVEYVVPDYYAKYPKPCMGGWGRKLMLITPAGDVLPCHAAAMLPGMTFENVEAQPLREIWEESGAFQKFRGEEWMPEPCRSCDRRGRDFGGCRCQAFLLAKDAAALRIRFARFRRKEGSWTRY